MLPEKLENVRVKEANLRLPTDCQYLIADCQTRPDFFYRDVRTAIYIDGPPHDSVVVSDSQGGGELLAEKEERP